MLKDYPFQRDEVPPELDDVLHIINDTAHVKLRFPAILSVHYTSNLVKNAIL